MWAAALVTTSRPPTIPRPAFASSGHTSALVLSGYGRAEDGRGSLGHAATPDLKSSSCVAVIISSHKSTVAMMNSIHTLLSENHPCDSWPASIPATMLQSDSTLSHLLSMTELEPYSYLRHHQFRLKGTSN